MSHKDTKRNKWPFPQESVKCSDKETSWRRDKASTVGKDPRKRLQDVYLPYIMQLNCLELQKLEQCDQDTNFAKLLREL